MARATTFGANGATFDVASGTTLTQTAAVSGTGQLTKIGDGVLYLTTTVNSFSGGTVINAGTVEVGVMDRLGTPDSGITINNGSTLRISGNITTTALQKPITLGAAGGSIEVTGANTFRHEGTIGGDGMLTKTGTGILYLVNAKNHTGGTAINGGAIQIFANDRLGTGGLSFNGGTLTALGTFTMNRATTLNAGGGSMGAAAGLTLTQQGVISGGGAFSKSGDGTVVLTAANTYTGATHVTAGTLNVTGSINQTSSLNVAGGTFRFGASNIVNDVAPVALGAGVIQVGNFSDSMGKLALQGAGTLNFDGNTTSTITFAGSADQTWTGSLTVLGWTGLLAGGGNERLLFGSNASGLTTEQLAMIFFVDPSASGLVAGTYNATMLSSGEVVPFQLIPEPSSSLLVIFGGIAAAWRRRR